MDRGRVVQTGTASELAAAPASAFVADFTGASVLTGHGPRRASSRSTAAGSCAPTCPTGRSRSPPTRGRSSSRREGDGLAVTVVAATTVGGRVRVHLAAPQPLIAELPEADAAALPLTPGTRAARAPRAGPRRPRAPRAARRLTSSAAMVEARVGVLGHTEWIDFAVTPAAARARRDPAHERVLGGGRRRRRGRGRADGQAHRRRRVRHRARARRPRARDRRAARRPGRDGPRRAARRPPAPRLRLPHRRRRAHDHRARRPARPARRRRPALGRLRRARRRLRRPAATRRAARGRRAGDRRDAAGGRAARRRRASTCSCTRATTRTSSTRPSSTRRRPRS